MEVLFENTYTRDKAMVRELYRYYYFKRPFVLVVYALLAAAMCVNIGLVVLRGWYFNIFTAAVVLFVLIMQFSTYRVQVSGMLQGDQDMTHGAPAQVTMQALPDLLRAEFSWGRAQEFNYDDIPRATRTKNLILLWGTRGRIHALRRDGFTVGTEEAFLAFLRKKGIKVR